MFDALVKFVLRDNPPTTQAEMSQDLGNFTAALANLKLGADKPASERRPDTFTSANDKDGEGGVVSATPPLRPSPNRTGFTGM